jgi:hypothetical protein
VHFVTGVTVLSVAATRTPWFFIAALVGPIAEASCGIAIAIALMATSRRTVWRMMLMMSFLQGCPANMAAQLGAL